MLAAGAELDTGETGWGKYCCGGGSFDESLAKNPHMTCTKKKES
jgi:hypothetical protein